MNILILTQYFPPEIGAASNRMEAAARFLVKKGHRVRVLTSVPNYPDGALYKGYKNKPMTESRDGIEVVRVPVYLTKKRFRVQRLLHYYTFMRNAYSKAKTMERPDAIWASSPPLSVANLGHKLKHFFNTKLILDVRDIWPESAKEVGALKNKFLLQRAQRVADASYSAADAITVTSEGIAKGISQKYGGKIQVIPNGIDSIEAAPITLPEKFNQKCIILYAGTLGLAQKAEVILDAARVLKQRKDIQFVIVGSGVCREKLQQKAQHEPLENVLFTGPLSRAETIGYVQRANLCLIPYKAEATFRKTLPSKLFEYMAAAKPVIINLSGEASELIKKAECGFCAEEENGEDLAKFIKYFADDPELAEAMGEKGRMFAEEHYNRNKILEKLEFVFSSINHKL